GQRCSQTFQRQLAGLAAGHCGGLVVRVRGNLGCSFQEVGGQIAVHAACELGSLLGESLGVGRKLLVPGSFQLLAVGLAIPVCVNVSRNVERCRGPVQLQTCQGNFVVAQWLAVGLGRVGAVGRALADVCL